MPENIKTVRIEVFGNEYNIRGQADPEYITRVAAYVDQKMRETNERLALPSISQVAILASLNIADELFRERDERRRAAQEVRDRAEHLEELLVATLSGSSAEPPAGTGRMSLEPQA
jgi:cell division protein ZapA